MGFDMNEELVSPPPTGIPVENYDGMPEEKPDVCDCSCDKSSLPEAGGVAFTELYTKNGNRINLTARSRTPHGALELLISAVEYAYEQWAMTGNAPKVVAPVRSEATNFVRDTSVNQITAQQNSRPAVNNNTVLPQQFEMNVTHIALTYTQEGKARLAVYGNAMGQSFAKYGVPMYDNYPAWVVLENMTPNQRMDAAGVKATVVSIPYTAADGQQKTKYKCVSLS